MRNAILTLSVALFSLAIVSSEVLAQSGSRGGASAGSAARAPSVPRRAASAGSSTRPSGSGSRGLPSAVVSRVGGARSKTIPSGGRPTGISNSANALLRSSQSGASSGSGSRGPAARAPSTVGAGSYSGTSSLSNSGLSRPSRRSKSRSTSTKLASTGPLPEGFRVWTDSTGRYKIQGKLAAQQDGTVWLRRTDGKLSKLSANQLSTSDQSFLATGGS